MSKAKKPGDEEIKEILTLAEEALHNLDLVKEYCRPQWRMVQQLIDKLKRDEITVAVIGQFKRGKSLLSNVILDDPVMPVGIVPVTSAITTVRYGDRSAEVAFVNGEIRKVAFADLDRYISEQKNPDNVLRVREVRLHTPSPFLREGITYVDTPGVGSYHENNTKVAYRHMKDADAVIFLLSVDSPINRIEIEFLRNAENFAGRFYFAVNKIDLVTDEELAEYTAYCRDLLMDLTGDFEIRLFPVSAKKGKGVGELKEAILEDCRRSLRGIMRESTRKKLIRVLKAAEREMEFFWDAMRMPYENLDDKFHAIKTFIEEKKGEAEEKTGSYPLHLNEWKLQLADKIKDLFGLEYGFEIEESQPLLSLMSRETYQKEVDTLFAEVEASLSAILLYREENAYTVIRRIEDINKATRHIRALVVRLERM